MKIVKLIVLASVLFVTIFSCTKEEPDTVEVTGTIQEQGVTTYQYGTHTIANYAIRSSSVNLDDYVNQNVTIVGTKIEGYPLEGGPEYLEVEKVK